VRTRWVVEVAHGKIAHARTGVGLGVHFLTLTVNNCTLVSPLPARACDLNPLRYRIAHRVGRSPAVVRFSPSERPTASGEEPGPGILGFFYSLHRESRAMSVEKRAYKIATIYSAWTGWPFAIAGGASALAATGLYGDGERSLGVFLVSLMGFCFGVGMIVFTYLRRASPEVFTRPRDRYPDEPWRWRKTWETRVLDDRAWPRLRHNWLIVLVLNAVIWPVAFHYLQNDVSAAGRVLIYFFLLIGVVQLLSVISRTRRVIRFGTTYLELDSLPAKRGGFLQANLTTKLKPGSGDGIRGRLECIRYEIRTRSQRAADVTEILCSIPFSVAYTDSRPDRSGLVFPIEIPVPADAEDTGPRSAPYHRVTWKLWITGPRGYSCAFEVPVYGTA
jgi:hypothetical protein